MSVTFTVTLHGKPLRRTYVSHFDFFRIPQTMVFRTDEQGRVTVAGSDPRQPTGPITVTVHAQNSVVRMLDGSLPIPVEVTQSFTVSDGSKININSNAEQQDHFRIMDACLVAYDTVFRQFVPFSASSRDAFPFGQAASIAATRDRLPRIEVVYPDQGLATLAYVEPRSLATGYPLIHIKDKRSDRRLFGAPDPVLDPTDPGGALGSVDASLIPHELSHALYFALMSDDLRGSVETQYLAWIVGRIGAGRPPYHGTSLKTTPFVAWIEALGLFAERFFFFSQRIAPSVTGVGLRQAFYRNELSAAPLLQTTGFDEYLQAGAESSAGKVVAALQGEDVEGAVYGAVFNDLARHGLARAVRLYLESSEARVLRFDDFKKYVVDETELDAEIAQVAKTWGM